MTIRRMPSVRQPQNKTYENPSSEWVESTVFVNGLRLQASFYTERLGLNFVEEITVTDAQYVLRVIEDVVARPVMAIGTFDRPSSRIMLQFFGHDVAMVTPAEADQAHRVFLDAWKEMTAAQPQPIEAVLESAGSDALLVKLAESYERDAKRAVRDFLTDMLDQSEGTVRIIRERIEELS